MDLLRGLKERVYPVGRLDYHSEGLLLFTNDGEFANSITAAVNHIPKTYLVKINGTLTADQEESFRHGLPIEGKRTKPAGLRLIRRAENPWYEIRLFEGRKNQIRMMFKHLGFLVEKLKRVQIGSVNLGALKPGEFRFLDSTEVAKLRKGFQKKP
jgi:pseudouridine synthase